MSASAILPVSGVGSSSSIDFGSSSATAAEQAVFASLLGQLQQAVGKGDLNSIGTLVHAVEALSPSSATASNPLGTFLTSLGRALDDGSSSEAQAALAVYQKAAPAATAPVLTANSSATAAEIAAGLVRSQQQLSLVTSLLRPSSNFGSAANASAANANASGNSVNSLIGLLNAAYGTGGSSPSIAGVTPVTPYDALVSSIQASLAAGHGTITPALAYLQATGNFVNTSA